MAKIGMEYVVYAKLGSDEETYSAGKYLGPTSAFNMTTNNNDIKDYGDDRAVESDVTLNDITISVEVNEFGVELEADLLGHKIDPESGEMVSSTEDVAPYLGVGFIGKSRSNNATIYRAIWLPKCQFKNPADDNSTKQESTTFNHSTLEGTAFPLADHTMNVKKEFKGEGALDAAKAWLNGKANIAD